MKKLTQQEQINISLMLSAWTDAELARKFKVSRQRIYQIRKVEKIPCSNKNVRCNPMLSEDKIAECLALLRENISLSTACHILGIGVWNMQQWLKRNGLSMRRDFPDAICRFDLRKLKILKRDGFNRTYCSNTLKISYLTVCRWWEGTK